MDGSLSGKTILVVDDERNIQASLMSVLSDEGAEGKSFGSGEDVLAWLSSGGRADAVLLDIWLPGVDGLETLYALLRLDQALIVIMMSGHGSITTAVKAVKEGAYDFLEKPLSTDKILFVLQRGLEFRKVREENERLKGLLKTPGETGIPARREPQTGDLVLPTGCTGRTQKTIAESNIYYGIGLHSGRRTGMVIQPLPPGRGIRFENISEQGTLPASIRYLDDTSYATSSRRGRIQARTIEHFMATLHAFGITNLTIKIDGEVPIGDGSAQEFCRFIRESGGAVDQGAPMDEVVVDRVFEWRDERAPEDKFIRVEPAESLMVTYTTVYPPPLGEMTHTFVLGSAEDFEREIAGARTYGFVSDFVRLSEMGLAEGGRIHNFIMIDQGRVINTQLRYPDELARHKILDILGDFYLLGRFMRGHIVARKTGHRENALMVRQIDQAYPRETGAAQGKSVSD